MTTGLREKAECLAFFPNYSIPPSHWSIFPSAYPEDGFPPLPIAAGAGSTASGNDEKEKEIVLGFCGFSMLAYFVLACGWIPATNCGNDGRGDKSVLVSYYFSMSSYTVDMGTWIVV